VAKRDNTSSLRRSNKSSFSLSCCSFGHLFARLPEDGQPKYLRCRKHSNFFCPGGGSGLHKIAADTAASTVSQ
jgi:hypothetical protein